MTHDNLPSGVTPAMIDAGTTDLIPCKLCGRSMTDAETSESGVDEVCWGCVDTHYLTCECGASVRVDAYEIHDHLAGECPIIRRAITYHAETMLARWRAGR